jgi:hypothetical protein
MEVGIGNAEGGIKKEGGTGEGSGKAECGMRKELKR